MDGEMGCIKKEKCMNRMLQELAEQLHSYKPPIPRIAINEVENKFGDIGSNFGAVEMKSMAAQNWREKRAAVLICLFQGHEAELRVILTKRSMKLSSHPGDVALPGGKMEERDEDDSATALREAMEEIGLNPELVQVVAKLEPFNSQNQLKVVPVIGLLAKMEDFNPVLNEDEVDVIFDAPLEIFLKISLRNAYTAQAHVFFFSSLSHGLILVLRGPSSRILYKSEHLTSYILAEKEDNHRIEEREWMGWKYIIHFFDFESEQGVFEICGLTASILIRAASVIFQKSPSFDVHLPDFQQLQRDLKNVA